MHYLCLFNDPTFADGMVKQFAETPLPAAVVRPFALSRVFAETIIGFLRHLGL
jgi:hypothetical protein